MAKWQIAELELELAQPAKCSANKKRNKIENNSRSEAKDDDPHRRYMPALKTNEMFPKLKTIQTEAVASLPAAADLPLSTAATRAPQLARAAGDRRQKTGDRRMSRRARNSSVLPKSRPKDEQPTWPRRR